MFNERLFDYRQSLGLNMREIAERLNVSESYYNLIENGKRNPSKRIIEKLVLISEKPEEYWIYGIEKEHYINERNDFKSLKKVIDQLMEFNLIESVEELFKGNYEKGTQEELIIMALKADITHILEKKNREIEQIEK